MSSTQVHTPKAVIETWEVFHVLKCDNELIIYVQQEIK
jgi:hypothetical protein